MARPRVLGEEGEAARQRRARYVEKNREKVREANRVAGRERKSARAIAEGRTPGLRGNPKRFGTEEERKAAGLEAQKRFRDKHREELRARWREDRKRRYLADKTPFIDLARRRRAQKRGAAGTHTVDDVLRLVEKQKGKCAFCLHPLRGKYHVDHYMPLALGGSDDISNLRLLHPKCNLTKGAKHPADFAVSNGLLCW